MILKRPFKALRWGLGFAVTFFALPLAAFLIHIGFHRFGMTTYFSLCLAVLGIRVRRVGPVPPPGSLVVMNHINYLDPVIFGSQVEGRYLAKSEIAGWPLVGTATRWGKSIFVERTNPRKSRELVNLIAGHILQGDRVLLFAEGGIVADGEQVANFRPMLFEASIQSGRPVAPVALRFIHPDDPDVWLWKDGSMAQHLWGKLFPMDGLEVEVRCGEALTPEPGETRKELAERAYREVVALCGIGNDDVFTEPGSSATTPESRDSGG